MRRKPTTISAYTHPAGHHRNPREDCGCKEPHVGVEFYVTVKDCLRTGWLLGAYATHEEALDNVLRGSQLAVDADRWAHFYAYGTSSVPIGTSIRTVFDR